MSIRNKRNPYHKWSMDEEKVYRQMLTAEQMGRLHFAVMRYVESGKQEEVAGDIRFAYLDQCTKADNAEHAYERNCAENAAKGRPERRPI